MHAENRQPHGAPDRAEVEAALGRLLDSPRFRESPRLSRLLGFLVAEVLAGRGDSLVQYRVATEGLGLPETFDPDASTLVRSHAGRLRKALAGFYGDEGIDEPVVIAMPPSGYRVSFTRARPRAGAGGGGLGMESPLLWVTRFSGIGLQEPWANLPDIMLEELLQRLGCCTHLRIARGDSSTRPRHVGFILDGSIEMRAGRLLIRSRMFEAGTQVQLWSRRHEYDLAGWDPAAFERDVIGAIAVEAGSDFGRIDRHLLRHADVSGDPPASLAAALMKAKAFEASYSEASFEEAEAALRRVLEQTPANPTARGVLAVIQLAAHCEYFRRHHAFPDEALGHLVVAKAGDPLSPFVRYGEAMSCMIRGDHVGLAAVNREIFHDPDYPPGLAVFTGLCGIYSRTADRGIRESLDLYMRRNPDYPRLLHSGFALECLASGDHEGATAHMGRFLLPDYWFAPVMLMAIHHAAGRRGEARRARVKLLAMCPDFAQFGREVLGRSLHPEFVDLLMNAFEAPV